MHELKILIVEDEDFVKVALQDYLEIKGYDNVLSAITGEDAVEIIEGEKPDLVLLDIQLAGKMDGMEVLRRAVEISQDIKVVMMSAYFEKYNREAKGLGAYGFMKKPITMEEFQKLLDELKT